MGGLYGPSFVIYHWPIVVEKAHSLGLFSDGVLAGFILIENQKQAKKVSKAILL